VSGGSVRRQVFTIGDMHCVNCPMRIDGALEDLDGVMDVSTSFSRGRTEVTYDSARVGPEDLLRAIRAAGYSAQLADM